jgi:hypothetical protein
MVFVYFPAGHFSHAIAPPILRGGEVEGGREEREDERADGRASRTEEHR